MIKSAEAHGYIRKLWAGELQEGAAPTEVTEITAETYARHTKGGTKNTTHEQQALEALWDELEIHGGGCIRCGKAWQFVKATLDYYKPSCNCTPRCPYCEHYLYQECARELAVCLTCGAMEGQPGAVAIGYCRELVEKDVPLWRGSSKTEKRKMPCNAPLRLTKGGCLKCDTCGQYRTEILHEKVIYTGTLPMKTAIIRYGFEEPKNEGAYR